MVDYSKKMKTLIQLSIYGTLFCLLFSSCATVMSGAKSAVSYNSKPQGAKIILVDKKGESEVGITPKIVTTSNKVKSIIFKMEGYLDEPYPIRGYTRFNWWYMGNILLGGIPGMVVDLITRGYATLPREVEVELKAK